MSRSTRSFAFVCMPAQGHLAPTLPIVAELVGRGHRVRYATGAGTAPLVHAAGAEPVPAPFVMPADSASAAATSDLEEPYIRVGAFAESVERTFPVLLDRFAADPPSAVCGDAMTPVAALLARRLGVPFVALHPTFASNRHFSLRDDVMPPRPTSAPRPGSDGTRPCCWSPSARCSTSARTSSGRARRRSPGVGGGW